MGAAHEHEWIRHRYLRTYEIAARLSAIASDPFAYLRELAGLTGGDGILDFLPAWQYDTVVHRFARWVADEMFLDDTSGRYVSEYLLDRSPTEVERSLPVDLCLRAYGLSSSPGFAVPAPDGRVVRAGRNTSEWRESTTAADACYDYFVEDVRPSEEYDRLLDKIADEVFHVVFHNRAVLFGLNDYLALLVRYVDRNMFADEPGLPDLIYKDGGRLRRCVPRAWVRNAVFFRDHGRCVYCGADLTGRLSALTAHNFDHIVPLALGGLNDVTNLQLLCRACNVKKSDSSTGTTNLYLRLYSRSRARTH